MSKSYSQIVREWSDNELEAATDEMSEDEIDISPESLSKYIKESRELDFSPEEAKVWLESRSWYQS